MRTRATLDDTEIGQLSSTPLLVEDDKPSKEVEESVKVLKDTAKTRKVAAEKVLSALSVIEKAKIDPSGFLETLGTNRRKKDSAKKRKFADFQKEEHEARNKVPNSDKLSLKRIDSMTLEVHVKQRRSKEEREDRGKYLPRKAANQKKSILPYEFFILEEIVGEEKLGHFSRNGICISNLASNLFLWIEVAAKQTLRGSQRRNDVFFSGRERRGFCDMESEI
ncbi:hypothetical protein Ahy_B05g075775 [Arachis hypogaea]|uniref:Uncharacterized protein n=1 Tax=Arachis hypogaea TaxID=3818 RepID=A0A444Z1Y8_ARAHY|nr:hypothetical protein Ahy_B05g075775 [Arachis hypogaea]